MYVNLDLMQSAEDLIRKLFWGIMEMLMALINTVLDSLINGVLNFDIFTQNHFLNDAFNCTLALMFMIIPVKIIFEVVSAMIKDDDAGLDFQKKVGSAFFGILIACSLRVAVVQVITPLTQQMTSTILSVGYISDHIEEKHVGVTQQDYAQAQRVAVETGNDPEQVGDVVNSYQIGDNLIETVLVSFGGLQQSGDDGANEFIKAYDNNELDIVERKDDEDNSYRWNFSLIMSIIALVVYVLLLLYISTEIAIRVIAIGFYFIIGPLCCTSLTNYQNPQAFVVWRNTIIGQYAQNVAQIFLLALSLSLLEQINSISTTYPIACAVLYLGAFGLVKSVPHFIQAMVGGYSSGIMDILSGAQSTLGFAKGISKVGAGLLGAGIGYVAGKHSAESGHRQGGLRGGILGNVQADGTRTGGIHGLIMGNRVGPNVGGLRGAVMGNGSSNLNGREGGLRGAIMGNDSFQTNADGMTTMTRSGGLLGINGRSSSTTFDSNGNRVGSSRTRSNGPFQGRTTTTYNQQGHRVSSQTSTRNPFRQTQTTTYGPSGIPTVQTNPSQFEQRVSSLQNRSRNLLGR